MAVKGKPKLFRFRFRFTADDDVKAYGEDWITYDETELMRRPARELMLWEGAMGVPLADIMNNFRSDSVVGDTCAAWLALKMRGDDVAFSNFNPAIMLAEWEEAPEDVDLGKAPIPEPASAPGSDSPIVLAEVIGGSSPSTHPEE
jgi:hypothetical protein